MRAKVTFRDGGRLRPRPQHLVFGAGDFAHAEDADLPPPLAEIVREWRCTYAVNRIPAQDVRATLRALASIDDAGALLAIRVIDDWTEAQLCGTAGRLWRRDHPDPTTPIPEDLFSPTCWPPERIRATARVTLKTLPRADGRRQLAGRDLWFAIALVAYWRNSTGRVPAVTVESVTERESEFLSWAWEMFHRAGRRLAAPTLAKVLWRAIRQRKA